MPVIPELLSAAELAAPGRPVAENSLTGHLSSSTDVGDVQHLMPVVTFYTGGIKGGLHEVEFDIIDEEEAYIITAKIFALSAYRLLKDKGAKGREIVEAYQPYFKSKEEYIAFMDKF